jgi:hypothetical protein
MGLSVSHGCWNGSYGIFAKWREAVARCIGIDLTRMQGFDTPEMEAQLEHYRSVGAPPDLVVAFAELQYFEQLPWEGVIDPLKHLLDHSDCEGSIATELCGPLADRLEAIVPLLPVGRVIGIGNWRDFTEKFVVGLRAAAAGGEDVEFS